ncbi:MAG: dihydropteroate synthase [Bacteroidales bacterium]|nr:dihydropteroate synthase [Candidatus Cryptobacteroides aphodequi]
MPQIAAILNLTTDSFWEPSRYDMSVLESGADIIDIGAVSTRPGAAEVSLEEEWARLEPVLARLAARSGCAQVLSAEPLPTDSVSARPLPSSGIPIISIDTTRAEIVRRSFELLGHFIVNDISAGEDDPQMLPLVGKLGLDYIAMHKRGNPRTMDSLTDYGSDGASAFAASASAAGESAPRACLDALVDYFKAFELRAAGFGIKDWILDPGLGFAKTPEQCWYILEHLEELKALGHPILIGAADKRFTAGRTEEAHLLALRHGADILRVHDVASARATIVKYCL